VPERLSAVHVIIPHYSVCARKAVCSSCHHTSLQYVCQQGCLQFMSAYSITVCVPARLSAVHVTIIQYSVCARKSFCSSSTILHYNCVTDSVSAVHVTIVHCSVCARKAVCSSCHHTALQWVCQKVCLQFMSQNCIKLCVPARLSAVYVTILHYSVCASKAVCSSCHHNALQSVCQQGCLLFMSPYFIAVCVKARLSAVHIIVRHYSVCARKSVCSSCHNTALEC